MSPGSYTCSISRCQVTRARRTPSRPASCTSRSRPTWPSTSSATTPATPTSCSAPPPSRGTRPPCSVAASASWDRLPVPESGVRSPKQSWGHNRLFYWVVRVYTCITLSRKRPGRKALSIFVILWTVFNLIQCVILPPYVVDLIVFCHLFHLNKKLICNIKLHKILFSIVLLYWPSSEDKGSSK